MGKGGGGGIDTSGLEAATREATALQKQMYEQGREDFQPWYQAGSGSINKLADLLGVTGGSVKSQDDIYSSLLPQYTTQQTTSSGQDGMYIDSSGNVKYFSPDEIESFKSSVGQGFGVYDSESGAVNIQNNNGYDTYTPVSQSTTSESIDYDALNAAVAEQMAAQGEVPEGYGSLLEKFSLDKFEEDPGYQFRQEEANKALERSMAAQGVTLGGAGFGDINPSVYRAMEEVNQGLASQEYSNAYNRYTQDQLNTFNMLMGASGQGAGVTGQMVQSGSDYATNVGNLGTSLASAQMNAQLQNQSSGGGMFGQLLGAGAGALLGNPALGAAAGSAIFG